MDKGNIEKLVKDRFENFEANVHPRLWNNIVSQLPASPVTHGVSSGAKGFLKSLSVKTVVTALAAVIASTVLVIYIATKEKKNLTPIENKSIVAKETASPSEEKTVPPTGSGELKNTTQAESKKEMPVMNPAVVTSSSEQHDHSLPKENTHEPVNHNQEPVNHSTTEQHQPAVQAPASSPGKTEQKGNIDNRENATSHADADVIQDTKSCDELWKKLGTPNIFTPNGDGDNDLFYIPQAAEFLQALQVKIFTFSGKSVYEWNGVNGSWDGKMKDGSDAQRGDYFCIIIFEPKNGKPCSQPLTLRLNR